MSEKSAPPKVRRKKASSTPAPASPRLENPPLLIVGVGASAGGLQPFKDLLANLQPEAGACVILAQHVTPTHNSALLELLAPKTALSVRYLDAPVQPMANTVLIVRPNWDVVARDGMIVPLAMESDRSPGPRPSIDRLFTSLASEFSERVVGIVLSGTGTDGTEGARAIKAAGGIVLVQDPLSAQFQAMPAAVIAARLHDAVMGPEQMGVALVRVAGAQAKGLDGDTVFEQPPVQLMQQVRNVIRRRTGFNLGHYKLSTVLRRVNRRMRLSGCVDLEEYLRILNADPDEPQRLAGDLSVRVTSFFRDAALFQKLRAVIDERIEAMSPGDVLRAWVPGCATGEEAYSLAILLTESFRAHRLSPTFLVFVSDINPESVAIARVGRYPEASIEKVPEELRQRYFEVRDGFAEVAKGLRQSMVFATQNVVDDPPFSKLDLVSCRNVLIYFEPPAQKHVLAAFHYALKPDGILFLGGSESVEIQRELFDATDKKSHIYRRRAHPVVFQYQGSHRAQPEPASASDAEPAQPPPRGRKAVSRRAAVERTRDIVAEHYSPPAIIIDADDRIVHFVGDLSHFVSLPRGPTTWTASQLVIAPLNVETRALVHRCRKERISIRGGSYTMEINGQLNRITLAAHPDVQGQDVLVLLAFEMRPITPGQDDAGSGESVNLIRELERELASTREHLQTLVEEVETSNEELQTLNEELQSSNEELQSTNEEMQTSNEELQSTNEELITVNEELANKTDEVETSRADLINLKEALDVGVVAVDDKLSVMMFNHALDGFLHQPVARIGVPLASLSWRLPVESIAADALEVIRSHRAITRTIDWDADQTVRLSIVPFRASSRAATTGAVLSFLDISGEVRAKEAQRQQETLYRIMLESSNVGILLATPDGVVEECNPAAEALTAESREHLLGRSIESLFEPGSRNELRSHLRVLRASGGDSRFDARLLARNDDEMWVAASLSTVPGRGGMPSRVVLQISDIHALKRQQERLAMEQAQLRFLNNVLHRLLESTRSTEDLLASVLGDLSMVFDDARISYLHWREAGLAPALRVEPGSPSVEKVSLPPARVDVTHLRRLKALEPFVHAGRRESPTGAEAAALSLLDIPLGEGTELIGVIRLERAESSPWKDSDISAMRALADLLAIARRDEASRTSRESAFRTLAEQRERIETTLGSIGDGVITTDTEGRIEYLNPPAARMCAVDLNEVVGKSLFNVYRVVRGDRGTPVLNLIERCLREVRPVEDSTLDLYLVDSAGKRIPINHSAAPIQATDGRMLGAVLVFRDVTDARLLARELSHRASHDPLTGLINRDEFERRAEIMLKEAIAGEGRHAVIAIDLDHFKPVNDLGGHAAGDAVLKRVAEVMRAKLRESDVLARVGGDEFAVLLRNCGEERAMLIAEGLVAVVAAAKVEWGTQVFGVGASAGVALMSPQLSTLPELLDCADAACYEAKRDGRGRTRMGRADGKSPQFAGLAIDLVRRALAEDRCEHEFQSCTPLSRPDLPTYTEMLLRLVDGGGQRVSPDDFVVAARRHHLLPALDRLSFRHSLAQIRGLGGAKDRVIAINLFAESVLDRELIQQLDEEARRQQIPPHGVVLEIPEAAASRSEEQLATFVAAARKTGFQVAMDQFGTQLNSFSVIRSLQLDFVKINLRVQDLNTGRPAPPQRAVLEALCHICRKAGTRTIAVGVETPDAITELREIGIDYLQGIVLSAIRPLSAWQRPGGTG